MWHKSIENNKKIAYVNARVMDPASGTDFVGTLITQGNSVVDLGDSLFSGKVSEYVDEVVDCNNSIIVPGLVDVHVHLRDPGSGAVEDIISGSKLAARSGITTLVCQPNTHPAIDSKHIVDYIKYKALQESLVKITTYAAVSKGIQGETMTDIAVLAEAGAKGFTDDGNPVMNSLMMFNALKIAAEFDLLVAQHAEDTCLSNGGCVNMGKISEKMGLPGIPNVAESAIIARDIELCRAAKNSHYHVLHVSTAEAVNLVRRAKEDGLNVTCEVTPHHFTLTEDVLLSKKSIAKMNPPLRTEEDRLAIIEGLKDKTIDCIATDHAPHECSTKENTPIEHATFGITGLETLLPLTLNLYRQGSLTLMEAVEKITSGAANIIKSNCGRIYKGGPADLAIIDIDKKWIMKAKREYTKHSNTPFDGTEMQGKVLRTIVSGNTVYDSGDL